MLLKLTQSIPDGISNSPVWINKKNIILLSHTTRKCATISRLPSAILRTLTCLLLDTYTHLTLRRKSERPCIQQELPTCFSSSSPPTNWICFLNPTSQQTTNQYTLSVCLQFNFKQRT